MDSATALAGIVYLAAAYLMVYIVYHLLLGVEDSNMLGFRAQPYDANRLILRRRYI